METEHKNEDRGFSHAKKACAAYCPTKKDVERLKRTGLTDFKKWSD